LATGDNHPAIQAEGPATGSGAPVVPFTLTGISNLTQRSTFDTNIPFGLPYALDSIVARLSGNPGIHFDVIAAGSDQIVRDSGSWIQDGFSVGQKITIAPASDLAATNRGATFTITAIPNDLTLEVAEVVTADILRHNYVIQVS